MSTLSYALGDSKTMLRRILRHTTRNPSTLIMSILLPGVLLLLMNYGFGGAIQTPGGSYLDYLVPGSILMGASYSVAATAVAVATEAGKTGWIAVAWCVGAAVAGYLWARRAYNRRTHR